MYVCVCVTGLMITVFGHLYNMCVCVYVDLCVCVCFN